MTFTDGIILGTVMGMSIGFTILTIAEEWGRRIERKRWERINKENK